MATKAKSISSHKISNRLSLTPTMQIAKRQLVLLTAYLTALVGTVYTLSKLKEPFQQTFETNDLYVFYVACIFPIGAVFFLHTIPSFIKNIRGHRRNAATVRGQLKKGYCRLTPLDEDNQDSFTRIDFAHEKVFNWILKTKEPILFLSGMSGCGKSSILNASVLPRLRKESPAYITLSIRSFENPLQTLKKELIEQNLINEKDQDLERIDLKILLERICKDLHDRHLLIVFDQFEELLIVHGEMGMLTQQTIEFLKVIKKHPVEGLVVIVVFRIEYQGLLINAGLGSLDSERNLIVVDPFTLSGATSFLTNSGLKLKNDQVKTILTEASLYERTKGFVRPITLNMIGLALNRIAVPRQENTIHRFDAGGILLNYTTESLESADQYGFARIVMKLMLSTDGTKVPQTINQLSEKTRLRRGTIESVLLNCKKDGLVRILDEPRHLWEISHDFVAALIAKAIGRDDRTLLQKTRPWLLSILLIGWIILAGSLLWLPEQSQMSFKEIIEDMGADYPQIYDPNNHQLNLRRIEVRDSDIVRLSQAEEAKLLRSLVASGMYITDNSLGQLKCFKQLSSLDLRPSYDITDVGLKHLKDLKQMDDFYLDLSSCRKITDEGLKHLKGLPLKILDLRNCRKITDEGMQYLEELPLKTLVLSQCGKITDIGLLHIKNMKQLIALDLSSCYKITDEGVGQLQNLPLEALSLSECSITDACVKHLQSLSLKELYLSSCKNITDKGIEDINSLKQLSVLDLSACRNISGVGFKVWLDNPLDELYLCSCDGVTNECLEGLKNFKQLRSLDLSFCNSITDDGLRHINELVLLEFISLSSCRNITDKGLEFLKDLRQIDILCLDLSGCDGITHGGLRNFKENYPNMEVIDPNETDIYPFSNSIFRRFGRF